MMLFRGLVTAGAAISAFALVAPATPAGAATHPRPVPAVRVDGAVSAPGSYTTEQLAALPQTTLTDHRDRRSTHQLTGVLLQTVIDSAKPELAAGAKNATLRVVATVSGDHRAAVATAWGELDPGFGAHPALLVLSEDGRAVRGAPELAFPDDAGHARSVRRVDHIAVSVAATAPATDLPAGDVAVTTADRTVVLSAARLARLPQQTRTVTFLASGATQTRVETGPSLAAVLRAARVRVGPATAVAASATDGYVAAVTPGEATSGGRPLLLSLVEDGIALTRPRLVVDGDLRGGRYVTDVTTLLVSDATRGHC